MRKKVINVIVEAFQFILTGKGEEGEKLARIRVCLLSCCNL